MGIYRDLNIYTNLVIHKYAVHDTNIPICFRASEVAGKSPRLFYVSTSASTTVISTVSICYVTSATAPLTCPGRKKRRVVVDGETGLMVLPSESGVETLKTEDDRELIGNSPNIERDGRFLLYWITTTSISSSTSYTTTWSVSSATCTPPGASLCG